MGILCLFEEKRLKLSRKTGISARVFNKILCETGGTFRIEQLRAI